MAIDSWDVGGQLIEDFESIFENVIRHKWNIDGTSANSFNTCEASWGPWTVAKFDI